jgi:hypothetical protein
MNERRTRNILLAIVATLLLVNLGVRLSPAAHAVPKIQYKAVELRGSGYDANAVQQALDQQSAQGWEYVGDHGASFLIFKK